MSVAVHHSTGFNMKTLIYDGIRPEGMCVSAPKLKWHSSLAVQVGGGAAAAAAGGDGRAVPAASGTARRPPGRLPRRRGAWCGSSVRSSTVPLSCVGKQSATVREDATSASHISSAHARICRMVAAAGNAWQFKLNPAKEQDASFNLALSMHK